MNINASDVELLAGLGSSVILDTKTYTAGEILMIIKSLAKKNGRLTVKVEDGTSMGELMMICQNYSDMVTFDFSR